MWMILVRPLTNHMMIFTKDCFTMTKCHIMLLTSYHMDQCTFMYKKPNQTNTMWHVLHQNNTNTSVFRCFSVFANTQYRKWLQPTILTLTLTERVPLINYWWLFSIILNDFDDSSRVRHAANLETRIGACLLLIEKVNEGPGTMRVGF